MIKTEKYVRKPLPPIEAVRVTAENIYEIAEWCQGGVVRPERNGSIHIRVQVNNPMTPRQTKAFVGDWVLYSGRGYKIYTDQAFEKSFTPVNLVQGAEKAKDGESDE